MTRATTGSTAPARWASWLLATSLLLAALPVVGIARRMPAALHDGYLVGDLASIEVGVVEAARGERLLGQPTRFGMHQLGPSHFYVQAPLYRALHQQPFALPLTCLLVNWAALLGLLYALCRWFEDAATTLAFAAILAPYLGYYERLTLFHAWGQYLIVLPTMLFIATAAAVATGRRAAWPWMLGIGSFVIQGYASSLPFVGATWLTLGGREVAVWWRRRRVQEPGQGERRRGVVVLAATAAVAALAWAPAVLEQWRNSPGNLRLFLYFFTHHDAARHPASTTILSSVAKHLGGPWLYAVWHATTNSVLTPTQDRAALVLGTLQVVLLAVVSLLALRRRHHYTAAVGALCLLAILAGTLAARGLDGDLHPYILFWLSACGALGWAVIGGFALSPLCRILCDRLGLAAETRRPAAAALVAACWMLWLTARPLAIPQVGDPMAAPVVADFERLLAADPGRSIHLVSHDFAWTTALPLLIDAANVGRRVTIENVQAGVRVDDLQGLSSSWLQKEPGSRELHVYDHDLGDIPEFKRLSCHPVQGFVAGRTDVCVYEADGKMAP